MSLLEQRDVIEVTGPDTAAYLQGQLSNDLKILADSESRWSFLLEPSGKLGFVVRVRRIGAEQFELDVEAGLGAAVTTRLRRFLIRTKVAIGERTAFVDVDGEGAGDALVGWWGAGTHRFSAPGALDTPELVARRVAAGWPAHGAEMVDGVIPGETGLVPIAVSFTKGCYTGQELVARIDSRGNSVPHLVRRLHLSAPAEPGEAVMVEGQHAGRLTSVAGFEALGFLHRRVDVPSTAQVGGAPARVTAQLPD